MRFWLPAHTLFEIVLIFSVVEAWKLPNLRFWLLMALSSHATARIWSVFDFIPQALAFEKAAQWMRRLREGGQGEVGFVSQLSCLP